MNIKSTGSRFSAGFKANVAIEALQERRTMAELSSQYGVHANTIQWWKQEVLPRSDKIFETKSSSNDFEVGREKLYAKIGQLEMEKEGLKKISESAWNIFNTLNAENSLIVPDC